MKKVNDGMSLEDAMTLCFQEVYAEAAVKAGFTKEQGLAILAYSALLRDLED